MALWHLCGSEIQCQTFKFNSLPGGHRVRIIFFFFPVELQIRKAFPKGRELEFPFNLSLVDWRGLPRGGKRCDGGRGEGEARRRLSLTFFSGKGDTSIGNPHIFGEKSRFISIQTW